MGKALDLTGQKFGKWTALRRHGSYTSSGTPWEVQCDCGFIAVRLAGNLMSGKSFGCMTCAGNGRTNDLTGRVFGDTTVLARAKNVNGTHAGWECACKCGYTRILRGSDLMKGKSHACMACTRLKKSDVHGSHVGSTIYKWTILELIKIEKEKKIKSLYRCQCACGTERLIPPKELLYLRTSQCKQCNCKQK